MTALLHAIHFLAGFYVLAESFNRLERSDPFDGKHGTLARLGGLCWLVTPWRWKLPKVLLALEMLAWGVLSVGAAGALITPLIHLQPPSMQDVAVIAGTALLIASMRFKEAP